MPPERSGDAGSEATPGGSRSRPAARPSGTRSAGGPKRPPRPDPEASNGSGNGPARRPRTAAAEKKKATSRKAPAKKASAKRAPAKKTASKRAAVTKAGAKPATTDGAASDGAEASAAPADSVRRSADGGGRRIRAERSDPVTRSTGPLAGDPTVVSAMGDDVLLPAAPVDFAPVPAPHVTRTAETAAVSAPAPAVASTSPGPEPVAARPGVRHGRRVKRVVRRIELWSVLKLCLVLYTCLYLAVLATLAVVWGIAYSSGQIENLQEFLGQVGLDNYRFYGDQMFRAAAAIGAIGVLAGTILTVLTAALINLISEMTGGIRVVVIEEDVDPGRRTS